MNSIIKWSGVVALVILAIMGVSALMGPSEQGVGTAVDCGSTTCFTTLGVLTSFQVDGTTIFNGTVAMNALQTFTSGLKIGSSGSTLTQALSGTCNLIGSPSVGATSTAAMDCAITGIQVNDKVIMQMATTSKTTYGMWNITAANASSTSGFATALVGNLTGAAALPPIGATSSVQYWIIR